MSSYSMTAIDPDTGQYIEVPIDPSQYLVQDSNVVQSGKSLIKPEFSHASRNPRITGGRKSQINQSNSGMMSLGIPQTSNSQIIHSQSIMGNSSIMNNSLSVDRMANAIAGTVSRGRPRGRRPLRGQFPVVPIDMVRQLGIEQQVILQPAAPVAMRNKSLLCRPLCMSRRTQANIITNDIECQVDFNFDEEPSHLKHVSNGNDVKTSSAESQTEKKVTLEVSEQSEQSEVKIKYIPIPVPVPIYIPVPVATRVQPMPYLCPVPLPIPTPINLLLSSSEEIERAAKFSTELNNSKEGEDKKITSPTIGSKRFRLSSKDPETPSKKAKLPIITLESGVDSSHHLKFSFGINAWCHWTKQKTPSDEIYDDLQVDLVKMNPDQLNNCLTKFVTQVKKPNKESYVADSIFYLCLGIQEYLNIHSQSENQRNIFNTKHFKTFPQALNGILANFQPRISNDGLLICRIEEAHLWEADQLGSSDPYTLLFTVVYLVTKYFGLRTPDGHLNLLHSNFNFVSNELFYTETGNKKKLSISPHQSCNVNVAGSKKNNQNRCPVNIIRKYISHYSNSDKMSSKSYFYGEITQLQQDSWYSPASQFDRTELSYMINRIKMVKEIQEAFMNSQHENNKA